MTFLARLLGRSRPPAASGVDLDALTDLWALVEPMQGSLTHESLDAMVAAAAGFSDERLVRADRQLSLAMSVMDTEEHARQLTQHRWTGVGEPFGRRRFVRALHTAVVAGPVAVARVRDRPEAVAEYDTSPVPPAGDETGSLSRRIEGVLIAREGTSGALSRDASVLRDLDTHGERAIAWPTVHAWEVAARDEHDVERYDPEGAWLRLWADLTDRAAVPLDGAVRDVHEAYPWFRPSSDAVVRVMAGLALTLPRRIGTVPLHDVDVTLVRWEGDAGPGTDAADVDPAEEGAADVDEDEAGVVSSEVVDGTLRVTAVVPAAEADAVPASGRTDALVRWTAAALAAQPLVHPGTREVLRRLAR